MTDTTPDTTPCSRCQAPIPEEDFEQGFAVRSQGDSNATCKLCVDAGDAQEDDTATKRSVIRAQIQQQNIYRYSDGQNPGLNRFTFLTAGHIALHRRAEQDQGEFDPPELSVTNDAETQQFTKQEPSTRENNSNASKHTRATQNANDSDGKEEKEKSKNPLYIGIAAASLVLIIFVISLVGGGNTDQQVSDGNSRGITADNQQDTKPTIAHARSDFAKNPLEAWEKAHRILDDNDPILDRIQYEVTGQIAKKLKVIREILDLDQDLSQNIKTQQQLQEIFIPAQRQFEWLTEAKQILNDRILLVINSAKTQPDSVHTKHNTAPVEIATKNDNKTSSSNTDNTEALKASVMHEDNNRDEDLPASLVDPGLSEDEGVQVKFDTRVDLPELVLPENANKASVRRYVELVMRKMEYKRSYSSSDLEVAKLLAVGPKHLDILLEERGRASTTFYLNLAIRRLAGPEHKDLILKYLPKYMELSALVYRNGWYKEAREVFKAGMAERFKHYPTEYINCAVAIRDRQILEDVRWYFVHGRNRGYTYRALQRVSDIDLSDEVRQIWQNVVELNVKSQMKTASEFALTYGHKFALIYAVKHHDWTSNYQYNLRTRKIILSAIDTEKTGADLLKWLENHQEELVFDAKKKKYDLIDF